MWLLWQVSGPNFAQHRLRTLLTLLGISIGVASVVATDRVSDTTLHSFQRAIDLTAGTAEVRIVNGSIGVPEALIETVRNVEGVHAAAPLIEGFVQLSGGTEALTIFGGDFLGDDVHTSQLPRSAIEIPNREALIMDPDAVVLTRTQAARMSLTMGASFEVFAPDGIRRLVVRGLADPIGPATLFGGRVAFMDLPAAQRLLGKTGKVDRIDVSLAPQRAASDVFRAITTAVAGRAQVQEASLHGARVQDLLFSIRVVVTLGGLTVILVGFFVIFQTVRISIEQRRRDVGLMISVGTEKREIVTWLAAEAIVIGTVAAALGLFVGVLMGQAALAAIGGLASAWTRIDITSAPISGSNFAWAFSVGLATTCIATLWPAWSVASQPPAVGLRTAQAFTPTSGRVGLAALLGLGGIALWWVISSNGPRTLPFYSLIVFVFGLSVLLIVSFALLAPLLAVLLGRLGFDLANRWGKGVSLLVASQAVLSKPAASVAVVAAIIAGFASTITNESIIASCKRSWLAWIDEHYQSDLLITKGAAASVLLTSPSLSEGVADEIREMQGVQEVQGIRIVDIQYRDRPVVIQGLDPATRGLPVSGQEWHDVADKFWTGAGVLVSNNLAHKMGLGRGHTVELLTPAGPMALAVLGVFSDFQGGGDLGTFTMSRELLRRLWQDSLVNRIRVWLYPSENVEAIRAAVQRRFGPSHGIQVVTAGEFRAQISGLVDQAFEQSFGLVALALLVSFIGVTNLLVANVLERIDILHRMRAIGASGLQLSSAVILEGGLVGTVGVLLSLACGLVGSYAMILYSIPMVNGWRLDYTFPGRTAVWLSLATIALASLAGAWPAAKTTRIVPTGQAE